MFHVKHEAWARDALQAGLSLGDREVEALTLYRDHLLETAVPRGYIARSDAGRLWERHLLDALRAGPEIPPDVSVGDLGSGAGIPGIPLAIVRQRGRFSLIEVRRGRGAFLEAVVDRLGLTNAQVVVGSVEGVRERFGICLARAFSPVASAWAAAEPRLEPAGSLIYWAGASFDTAELRSLGVRWRLSEHPGLAEFGPLVIMSRQ